MDLVTAIGIGASLAQLIELITQTVSFLNDIKNAPKERAELAVELAGLLAVLISLRYQIEDSHGEGRGDPWFAAVRFLGVKNGPVEQLETAMKSISATIGVRSNLKNSIAWPFKKRDVEKLLTKIERLKALINLAFQKDLAKLVYSIKTDIEMLSLMDENIKTMAEKIEVLVAQTREEKERVAKERLTIIEYISPLNFYLVQNEIFAKRMPGTGLQLLGSKMFTEWVTTRGKTLWCCGIPGAGKTVFSSIAVNYLRQMFEKRADVGVAVVYCSFQEQYKQKPTQLLAAIWRQLMQDSNGSLSSSITLAYMTHRDRGTFITLEEISDELKSMVERLGQVFIVIDALDETSELDTRQVLLTKLQLLIPKANILVTSRPLDNIRAEFHDSLQLDIEADINDVEMYIRARIQQEGRLQRHVARDPNLEKLIVEEVSLKTRKMFLLAKLHMDLLATKGTRRNLELALKTLPKELDKTYDEAMRRIANQNEDDRELAWKILSWICVANRPLGRLEIQHALAVEVGDSDFDDKNVADEELLTSVCAGLVIIDPINNSLVPIHYTTQEYFEHVLKARFKAFQSQAARICLTYLSFDTFIWGKPRNMESYSFYSYAAKNWLTHLKSQKAEMETEEVLNDFLRKPNNVNLAVKTLNDGYQFGIKSNIDRGWTGLHIATSLRLENLAQELIDTGTDVNTADDSGDTALHVAVNHKHLSTMRTILCNNPNVDTQNRYGQTALHCALRIGNLQIVSLLFDCGASSNVCDVWGRTALHYAAIGGNVKCLSLVLHKYTDLDAVCYDHYTAFYYAVLNSNEGAVDLLISRGANVNIAELDDRLNLRNQDQDESLGNGRTALHRAAECGNIAILEAILACNPDVSRKDGDGYTALYYAVLEKHSDAVMLLLTNGANADNKLLSLAIQSGDTSITEMIIQALQESKIEIDPSQGLIFFLMKQRNNKVLLERYLKQWVNRSIHCWAFIEDLEDGVRLLVDAGANVNQPDDFLETPLHDACEFNKLTMARQLLAAGANANSQDLTGATPLHRGASMNSRSCLLVLLQHPTVEMALREHDGRTGLHFAAQRGAFEALQILLNHRGCEVDGRDNFSRTPLIWAAENGHSDVVEALLRAGADANTKDGYDETALHRAAANNHQKVTLALLDAGANPDAKDLDGETPIHQAERNGNSKILRLLKQTGRGFQ